MSWVTIDKDLCTGCGICVQRCLRCFTDRDGEILSHADVETCNICGHCVSLCPTGAITHSLMDMGNFMDVNEDIRLDPDEFLQLVRRRRSHRSYKDRKIPRKDLDKLLEMCRYIPTGSNLQTVEIKVVTNPEKIRAISDACVDYFMETIRAVETQAADFASQGKELPEDLVRMKEFANRYKMMGLAREMGLDPILHKASALMVFHSAPSPSTPKDDCVIAAQTAVLGAMTMGLGTCYIGLLLFAAAASPAVKAELDLPAGNKPHSALVLGYPKLKFMRTIDRKPQKVQWVE